jgi:hypothetical protein
VLVVVLDPFPPASSERRILSNPQPPLSRPPSSSTELDCDVPIHSCSFYRFPRWQQSTNASVASFVHVCPLPIVALDRHGKSSRTRTRTRTSTIRVGFPPPLLCGAEITIDVTDDRGDRDMRRDYFHHRADYTLLAVTSPRRRRIRTLSVVGKASRLTFRIVLVLVLVVVLDPFPPASSERRILSNPQPLLSRPPSSSIEQDCDVPTQSCSFYRFPRWRQTHPSLPSFTSLLCRSSRSTGTAKARAGER